MSIIYDVIVLIEIINHYDNTVFGWVCEHITQGGMNAMLKAMEILLNKAMV